MRVRRVTLKYQPTYLGTYGSEPEPDPIAEETASELFCKTRELLQKPSARPFRSGGSKATSGRSGGSGGSQVERTRRAPPLPLTDFHRSLPPPDP